MFNKLTGYLRGDGFQARTFRGTALTFLNFGGQNFLRLASNLILTRLLFPEAFGLMALVGVVLTAAIMFSEVGIRGSIIQDDRGEDPDFLNTAWTFQIIRGFLLGAAIILLADPLAAFYEEPLLADLLTVSAFVPVLKGFESTKLIVANRQMLLGRITFVMLGSRSIGIVTMIILAWLLESVWALVIGSIVSGLAMAIASHVMLPGISNRLKIDRDCAGRIFSFGKFVFLSTVASFFVQQGSNAVLGKFVDLDELAFFRIAFFLASIPVIMAQVLSDRVIFPLYARRPPAQSDVYRRKINRARFALTGGLVAFSVLMALLGNGLVQLLYDDRYAPAGPLLILIAVFSLPQLMFESYWKLPLAAGNSGRHAFFMVTFAGAQMLILLLTVPTFGAVGAALAPGLAMVLCYPLMIWTIYPYKGWDPLHDVLYIVLTVTASGGILWLNWPLVAPLFAIG